MSEQHTQPIPEANGRGTRNSLDLEERGLRPPPEYGFFRRLWWWFDFLILVKLARLRFIAILVAIGVVIAYWDTFVVYYEKWTRDPAEQTKAAADTEFWCPMHPTIIRDKPDKCPICGMPLSKRKKGEKDDEALPPGVVARVQLTPYRVTLAGITTSEVGYQRLHRDITTVGFVEYDERKLARITARATGKSRIDKLYVNVTGQTVTKGDPLALLYSPDLVVSVQNLLDARSSGNSGLEKLARQRLQLWGIDDAQIDRILKTGRPTTQITIRSPISGHIIKKYQVEGEYVEEGARLFDVADLSTVWVEAQVYEDELAFLREGLTVSAFTRAFPNRAFEGKLAFIHPHMDAATRTLKVRFDMKNPDHALRPGMYASVTLRIPAVELPGVKEARKEDQVLAVPEQAVIDTGDRTLVYREAEPDVYDAVLVRLGPRCGNFFPVLSGLKAGDRVTTSGTFLLDAETRLSAGAGSTYFGASGGPQADRSSSISARPSTIRDEESKVLGALAKLSAADRRLAEEQRYCPVLSDNLLGSMGVPVKVIVKGQTVFLCCRGCRKKAMGNPDKTLAKIKELKAKQSSPPKANKSPAKSKEAKIQANLAKLDPTDRKLAEAQRWCAVLTDSRLGSMGKPMKVMLKGKPVFLCCDNCEDEAKEDPTKTLATAERLKAKSKSMPPVKGGRP